MVPGNIYVITTSYDHTALHMSRGTAVVSVHPPAAMPPGMTDVKSVDFRNILNSRPKVSVESAPHGFI